MKKWIFLISLIFVAFFTSAGELRLDVSADWMLTIRGGIEYRFNRFLGVQTKIGTNTQLLAFDFTGVFYFLDETTPWRINLLAGIPNAAMPLTFNAGMISVGASILVGYRFKNELTVDLRIGAGFPFFFEEGKSVIRDIQFPFGLWPDLAVIFSFPPWWD